MTGASTRTSRIINAPRAAVWEALTDPTALVAWRAPGDMTGTVHEFDLRVGGGYRMSLYYPADDREHPGKTTEGEDRFSSRFLELEPPSRIAEAITFDAEDAAFSGEMRMEMTLEDLDGRTGVTITFHNLPPGVRPEDNDAGTRSSLEKLGRLLDF